MTNTAAQYHTNSDARQPLIGLAPQLRLVLSGADITPLGQKLLDLAASQPDNADVLMDLSTLLQFKGNRDIALQIQAQALAIKQLYHLPAAAGRTGIRVLAIMGPGDLMANMPLECMFEGSDVALHMLYVGKGLLFPETLPNHDVAIVAISESDDSRQLLKHLDKTLQTWPRPVLNMPDKIARLSRDGVSSLLLSVQGIDIPISVRIGRQSLQRVCRGETEITAILHDGVFPIIARPAGAHAGHGLAKLDSAADLANYLETMPEDEFSVARFVDYKSADGMYRKYRIVLIDGQPYVCHMAIADHWMVNYQNSGMAENAVKRTEEAQFMAAFDSDFARRHGEVLRIIHERIGLDYFGIDCAENSKGELLIFEIDHAMLIHAMDPVDIFPYKQTQMRKVFGAFRNLLEKRRYGGSP